MLIPRKAKLLLKIPEEIELEFNDNVVQFRFSNRGPFITAVGLRLVNTVTGRSLTWISRGRFCRLVCS